MIATILRRPYERMPPHLVPRRSRGWTTYCISSPGYVKIGKTQKPLIQRLASLQTGNPCELWVFGYRVGDVEALVHRALRGCPRGAGREWFVDCRRARLVLARYELLWCYPPTEPRAELQPEIVEWLRDVLVEGPLRATRIHAMADARGWSPAAVRRAAHELGVWSSGGQWTTTAPDDGEKSSV